MEKYNDRWTMIFPGETLDAGWDYYLKGKVKNLVETDYGFQARVRGKRNYHVDIYVNNGFELMGGVCTCSEGDKIPMCKHIAAALYLIESDYEDLQGLDPEYFDIESIKKDYAGSQHNVSGENHEKDAPALSNWFAELDEMQKRETSLYLKENPSEDMDKDVEEYRYFRYDRFRNGLDIPKNSLKNGLELLNNDKIRGIHVDVGFSNQIHNKDMIGVITGMDTYGYQYTRLLFDRNGITDGYCNIWGCRYRSSPRSKIGHKLCEHEAGLLIYLENYLKQHNPGDASNEEGVRLYNYMSGSGSMEEIGKEEEKGQMLELVPVLHNEEGKGYTVSFKVGAGRLYVVKKLPEFMEYVNDNKVMTFGRKTKLLLGRAWFDPVSLSYLDFIEHAILENGQMRKNMRPGYEAGLPELTNEIPLYGNTLDELFDIPGPSRPLEYVIKTYRGNKKSVLYCRDSDYHPSLSIRPVTEKATGAFQGILLTGNLPSFIFGQRYAYYIDSHYINRIPVKTAMGLRPLLSVQQSDRLDVRIGRRHLSDFYSKMLPKIREVADVEEDDVEVISQYLPAEPVFLCYLDVVDDLLCCRIDVAYGNKIHNMVEELITQRVVMNYRNLDKEDAMLEFLYQFFPHVDDQHMLLCGEREEESVFLFLSEGLSILLERAEVHMTDRFRRLGIRRNIKYNLGVSMESNILDLDITSAGYSREELLEILKAYKRKANYIRLKDGDFLKIDQNESVAALAEIMDSLHLTPGEFVKGKMHIPAYRALYLDKMMENSQFIEADRSKTFRKLIREFDTATNADYDVPAGLETVLRNYQKDGYQWLRTLDHLGFGGILADEMGLGKTLQVITVLLADRLEDRQTMADKDLPVVAGQAQGGRDLPAKAGQAQGGRDLPAKAGQTHTGTEESKTSLIVCPASLVYNWKEELSRFAPQLNITMAAGTKNERKTIIAGCLKSDVIITSYDLLKRDINEYEDKSFRFMIIDEAQYIKNQQTAAAKSVKLIRARTRYALTGTPIENRLSDMWSIFDYLMPGFLYEYTAFRREYEQPIVKNGDKELSDRLSRMASPFILRRKKMNVLKDLPEKLEEIRYAGMEKTQRKLYDAHVVRIRKSLEKQSDDEFRKNRIQVLAELTKLRQICCDPSLYFEDYDGGSAKREACMNLVENIVEGEHKALIFSQFTTMLELLEKDLTTAGISYYKITGSTPKEKRFAMVNAFNADDTPIFLISLKAGGTGLNLTGADVVIHYDPWWNLAVQNQATDRAHRIGQTQIVTVYKLIIKGTIEERIVEMQESKKQLAEDILGGENIGSATISKEDLLALL